MHPKRKTIKKMKNQNKILLIIILASLSTFTFASSQEKNKTIDLALSKSNLNGMELEAYYVDAEVVAADSVQENRIEKVWTSDGATYFAEVVIKNTDSPIILEVFNMLAKPVILVHRGEPNTNIYQFDATILPNGPYFCVLQGQGFRDTYKFTVNR